MSTSDSSPSEGLHVPENVLLRRIGRGSSGEVWLARSAVTGAYHAIKIIRRANFPDEAPYLRELKGIRKFEPISRSHSGFVNILQVGQATEKGYFYYLMELADGVKPETNQDKVNTIEQFIREGRRFSVDDVLDLGIRLSDALHCLHEAGLIHRDIKPSNLLFVAGRPKLADIGLVTDEEDAASLVGTPGYIPPEGPGSRQADVYALGKVLYECLTGLDRSRFPDLPTFFDGHPDQEGFLELNEVILKACHQDPRHRYRSARQLHADLIAIENGESVIRLRELELKLARFKRTLRWAGIGLLVAGAAGFLIQRELGFREQERQRTVGTLIGASVRAINDGDYSRALRDSANVLGLLPSGEAETINRLRFSTTLGQMPKLSLLQALDSPVRWCDFTPDASGILTSLADGRCQIRDSTSGRVLAEFPGHTNSVNLLLASHGERWLVSAGEDGTARLWERSTSQAYATLNHPRAVTAADFHPKEPWLATASADGVVRIWDIASGEVLREIAGHSQRIETIRFSHSGALIATGSRDGNVRLWRVENGAKFGDPIKHDNWVFSVSFSPDDRRLVTACADHAAYVWLVDSGRLALPPFRHERGVRHAEFSPDGSAIATAGWDDVLGIWDSVTGAMEPPLLRHSSPLSCVRFSAGANRLVTGCTDGTIRVWDRAGRTAARRVAVHQVSADGSTFLRRTGDTVEIQSVGQEEVRSRIQVSSLKEAFIDSKGRLVGTIETNPAPGRALRIWEVSQGVPLSPLIPLPSLSSRNYFDPTGTRIAVVENNSVTIYQVASGQRVFPPVIRDERINAISFSADGSKLALASQDQVEVRNAETGQLLFPALTHQFKVSAAVFSPDSRRLAVCTSDTRIAGRYAQVWDATTGRPSGGKLWHRDGVTTAAWAADGRFLLTVSEHGVGQIWSMPGGEPVGQEIIHREQVLQVALRTKPSLALTGSRDTTARIWDPLTGDPVSPAYRFPDTVAKVWFCPDLTRFVVQEVGGPIWIQDVDLTQAPPPLLQDLANVLTGRSALHSQTDDFNAARDLATRWERTRSIHPEWFSVSKDNVLAWRRMEAERFRQRKHHAFELYQVNEILRAHPTNTNAVLHKKRLEELLRKEGVSVSP